ncbi:MAG TPA: ABC transporter permease [Ktedonobacteraceae bacterium]|nr:ABC transporter permease [Ktedonobacteraceae bacterium]
MFSAFFRAIWTICRKDLTIWSRQPTNIAATVLPPLAFLLIEALGAAAVGHSPVALVVQDHGPKGQQMAQIFQQANVFKLQQTDAQHAQQLFNNLDVVAIVTIPADFTQQVQIHNPSPVIVRVNNLNLDFTNDIRRSVPDVITQFYQAQGPGSPIKVTPHEQDLRAQDIELFQFNVLPTIVLLLTISGLVTTGLAAGREWETLTIKEMLISPATNASIIIGKVLAGFLTTFGLGLLVLGLGYALDWTRPEGIYWLSTLLIMALIALFSSGLGIMIGAFVQRIQAVTAVAINVALYLFFLSGGISVLAFEPDWLQNVGAFIPLTYGTHALQMAVFYQSSDQLGRDILILTISTLVALSLGTLAMRRGIRA